MRSIAIIQLVATIATALGLAIDSIVMAMLVKVSIIYTKYKTPQTSLTLV